MSANAGEAHIAQGAHPKAIQERLGHSTIRLTFDRYGHLFPSLDEQLVDGLDEVFSSSRSDGARTKRVLELPERVAEAQ
jgi:hypothetical protein